MGITRSRYYVSFEKEVIGMEEPWRLPITDDYDEELVAAQMNIKLVEGIGFSGWREDAIIDPAEIVGSRPGQVSRWVSEQHEAVLTRSLRSQAIEK
jgi:hypothetical protein